MKKLLLILAVLSLTGCATWEKMSDKERQAWIIGGSVVLAAVALSTQEDKITTLDNRDICFESTCEVQ